MRKNIQEAYDILTSASKLMLYNDTLRCSYDDHGTGSSGMAKKPCKEHRGSDPTWWCTECRVKDAIEKADVILAQDEGERERSERSLEEAKRLMRTAPPSCSRWANQVLERIEWQEKNR